MIYFGRSEVYLDRLLNQGNVPVLEQLLSSPMPARACSARTSPMPRRPDFVQKDMSVEQFQEVLAGRRSSSRIRPRRAA